MKYAVVSYWVGETGDTELWLYDTENEAIEALKNQDFSQKGFEA